ncbi:hypothetical protein [Orbus mooreae]|uniref:hypothetical protein n=1 Tax=Orbus mooreae TaxID=3074107 RepID=UPI00370DD27F
MEVSDIDLDKLQAIIDKVGNQVDLASGVSGIASSVIQNAINDVFLSPIMQN